MKKLLLAIVLVAFASLGLRAQFISVPNFSFETPATDFASPAMDDWLKLPQSPFWDTNFGSWDQNTGEFANSPPGQPGNLVNCDGAQAAYIVSFPDCGIYQTLSNNFQVGRSYQLTVALTTSTYEPLTNGTTIQLRLYYAENATNLVTVGATNITFDPGVFTNFAYFLDFPVNVPEVQSNDPWAGQPIGIDIHSTASFQNAGGVWDADNVRLTQGPSLSASSFAAGQFTAILSSYPGLAFNILASANLNQSAAAWSTVATVTNTTGSTNISLPVTASQQFYLLKQLP